MKATWVLAGLILSTQLGAQAPVSLGQAVPSDFYFYLRSRANPDRKLLAPALAELKRALEEAKMSEYLLNALSEGLTPPEQKAFLEEARHWLRVLDGVAWEELFSREYAMGASFGVEPVSLRSLEPTPRMDWIALFRVDPARRDRHLAALREVALSLGTMQVEIDDETGRTVGLEVTDTSRDGVPTVLLSLPWGETRFCLSGQGDVVAASSASLELRRAFKLLLGQGSGRGVAEEEEFRRLMAGLPPGQDGEVFLRPRLIFDEIRAASKAVEQARLPEELSERGDYLVRALSAYVDTFDLVKSAALSETTAGKRLLGSFRIDLVDDAPKRKLYAALLDRPPVEDFARLVPAGVCGFMVSSGCDLVRLHDALADFVDKVLPEGGRILEDYRRWQDRSGFDVKRDLLGLIEGQLVFLGFPAPAGGGWVSLLKLREPARAEAKLTEWLGKGLEGLKALGMGPERIEIPDVPGSFRRVALPMPPGMEVTFGISGDLFALGTNRERIREAILVRSGKVENILKNPGWSSLGLKTPAAVQAVSFRDLGELWGEVQAGVQSLSILAALIPDDAAGKPPLPKRLLLLGPRLAPVVRALGFLDKGGGYLARDGNGFRGEIVLTVNPGEQKPPGTKRKF
jgi:hypothetical protein